MSKIIGLIACSSRKLGQDNPAEKYWAKDIYKGNTFIKSKNYFSITILQFGIKLQRLEIMLQRFL